MDDLLYLRRLNDSTLYSFNRIYGEVAWYKREPGGKLYRKYLDKRLGESNVVPTFLGRDPVKGQFLLAATHFLYAYDDALNLCYKRYFNYDLPFLGKEYDFYAENLRPALFFGDTFITTIVDVRPEQQTQYLKEDIFHEFILNKDTLCPLRSFMKHPAGEGDYYGSMITYTTEGNNIIAIFPAFDTIYKYEIRAQKLQKIPIRNKDFHLPEKWDNRILGQPDYYSKLNKYLLRNFWYEGIVLDTCSDKYYLFYLKKHENHDKKKLPVFGTDPQYVIVLNKKLGIERYYKLPGAKYNRIFIPDTKGIAIPELKKNINDETILKFTVFRF